MKKLFILMLGLVAGTASFAQTTIDKMPAATVSITNDYKVKLIIAREEATAAITLRDADGHVLYTDYINLHNGLRQNFDVTQLGLGTYQLVVAVGKETMVKTFTVDEQPAQKLVAIRS